MIRGIPFAVWRLMFAYAFMMGGTALTVLLAGIISLELAPEPGLATLPIALAVVGVAASTLPTGRLLQIFGRRSVFLAYGVLAIGSALLNAYALVSGSFWLYCSGAFLMGWSAAAGHQYRFAALELVAPERAAQATSILLLGGIIGAFIGPELAVRGRYLADTEYLASYLLLAGAYVLGMVIIAFYHDAPVIDDAASTGGRPIGDILRQPVVILAIASAATGYGVMTFLMTATPISMHEHAGHSLEATKWVIQSHIAGMYLPSLLFAGLVSRFGLKRMLWFGVACYVLTLAVAAVDTQAAALLAGSGAAGYRLEFPVSVRDQPVAAGLRARGAVPRPGGQRFPDFFHPGHGGPGLRLVSVAHRLVRRAAGRHGAGGRFHGAVVPELRVSCCPARGRLKTGFQPFAVFLRPRGRHFRLTTTTRHEEGDTGMQHRINGLAGLFALGLCGPALAWDDCENRRVIEETLDVSATELLQIVAGAGELEITGREGQQSASVTATVCASSEEYAEASRLDIASGGTARIATVMPEVDGGGWGSGRYLYIDLEIIVPETLSLDVRDSSGDMVLRRVGAVTIQDSSGDIEVSSAASVELKDSSGDIELETISGDVVVVADSSGDIRGEDIGGSVVVERDSSGDIRFRGVGADFLVERDSSGDIVANTVGGDFSVIKDGSGSINYRDVQGEVRIPEGKE